MLNFPYGEYDMMAENIECPADGLSWWDPRSRPEQESTQGNHDHRL